MACDTASEGSIAAEHPRSAGPLASAVISPREDQCRCSGSRRNCREVTLPGLFRDRHQLRELLHQLLPGHLYCFRPASLARDLHRFGLHQHKEDDGSASGDAGWPTCLGVIGWQVEGVVREIDPRDGAGAGSSIRLTSGPDSERILAGWSAVQRVSSKEPALLGVSRNLVPFVRETPTKDFRDLGRARSPSHSLTALQSDPIPRLDRRYVLSVICLM